MGASTLRVSQIDHYDTENNMRASNISTMSKKSKASDLIKMNKSHKIMDINQIRQCLTDLQWNLFFVHENLFIE